MAGESLGTARLDIEIDLTKFQASVDRAKSVTEGLSDAASQAFSNADASGKRAATSFIKYAESVGKTTFEQKALNAELRGAPKEVVRELIALENSRRAALHASAKAAQEMAAAQEQMAQSNAAAKIADENNKLREQQRVVAVLTQRFHELEAAEKQAADFDAAARTADENNRLREQQRVVAVLTQRFHELEAAEKRAAEFAKIPGLAQQNRQLREQGEQLAANVSKFNEYGLSAKQTQAALRQVPAQITDIFVSLQGGQNPLTVLIQQGGQLKDVFGGIKPAAEALGAGIARLATPLNLGIAGFAALLAIMVSVENQANNINRALILSGDAASTTADDVLRLARTYDQLEGVTSSGAVAVINQIRSVGIIAKENYDLAARAALAAQAAGVSSAEEIVASFEAIARNPVQAALKLNETYRFLTDATLNQAMALERQGDVAAATKIINDAFANSLIDKSGQISDSLGLITGAWRNVKKGTVDTWDAGKQFFADMDQRAKDFAGVLDNTVFGSYRKLFNLLSGKQADLPTQQSPKLPSSPTVDPVKARAIAEYEQERLQYLSREERHRRNILELQLKGAAAGKTAKEIAEDVARATQRYEESLAKPRKDRSAERLDNAESKRIQQEFEDTLKREQAAIQGTTQVVQAQYSARIISAEDYYANLRMLVEKNQAAEEAAVRGQIDALKARKVSGVEAERVLERIGELEARLAAVRAEAGTNLAVLGIQEQDFFKKRKEGTEAYAASLWESNEALRQQTNAAIARIGMGQAEAAQIEAINQAYADQAVKLRELNRQIANDPTNAAVYQAEVRALKAATDEKVLIIQDGYRRMLDAQQNWLSGVQSGIADWSAQTSRVADQTRTLTTGILDRLSDGVADFVTGTKASFKELLADILRQVIAFFAKQVILNLLQLFFPGISTPLPGAFNGASLDGNAKGNSFPKPTPFKKGGDFTNSVVNKPTLFKFAKGTKLGMMGEAGDEAIMPLKRGADGTLGVRMFGGGSGDKVLVQNNITINSDGSSDSKTTTEGEKAAAYREFADEMRNVSEQTLQRAMRPGGTLWRAGVKLQ